MVLRSVTASAFAAMLTRGRDPERRHYRGRQVQFCQGIGVRGRVYNVSGRRRAWRPYPRLSPRLHRLRSLSRAPAIGRSGDHAAATLV